MAKIGGSRYVLTRKQTYDLFNLLRLNTEPVPGREDDEVIRYKGDWSDENIADALARKHDEPRINGTHVARARVETLGRLLGKQGTGTYYKGAKPGSLRVRLLALETNFNALCDNLGVSQYKVDRADTIE